MKILSIVFGICIGILVAHGAGASPYFSTTGIISFTAVSSEAIQVFITEAKITDTGNSGKSDPLIGKYQSIYTPSATYDFTMTRSEKDSNIFIASSDPLALSAQSKSVGGTNYLTGNLTAIQVDFTTGAISWSTVTDLAVSNTIKSSTLEELSSYSVGTLQFSFDTTTVMKWIESPSGVARSSYSSTFSGGGVSGAPEPDAWLLMVIGLLVMAYWARRRLPAAVTIRIAR